MAATETVQIEMPAMGESVTEGTVLDWLKQEGDHVEEGETIVEVSTDKVDAEVPAPASGVLTKILKGPDEVVKIGEALAELEPGGGASPSMETTGGEGDADLGGSDAAELQEAAQGNGAADGDGASSEPIELVMPEMGESVSEGTVLEWLKQPGDSVEEGETVIEVSTDKVDAEVPSPVSGTLTETLVEPDDVVAIGQALARIQPGAGASPSASPLPPPATTPRPPPPARWPATATQRPHPSPAGSPTRRASTFPASRARARAAAS